jgi:AcrR family transcriptional regulator
MARSGTAGITGDDDETPDRAARRTTRKELRRQLILDAAAEEFAACGYERATLERIGERVALSKASLYYYVSGKEQLFTDIVDQFVDEAEQRVLPHLGDRDAVGALEALVRCHLSAVEGPIGRALVANLHELRREGPKGGAKRYERLVADIIQQGMDSGRIRTVPVRPAVNLFIGALNGVSQWFNPDGKLPLEDVVEGVVGVLLRGVETTPAALHGGPSVP